MGEISDRGSEVAGAAVASFSNDTLPTQSNTEIASLARSPVKISVLKQYLQGYDQTEAEFILHAFLDGFPIQYTGPRAPRESKNLRSTELNPSMIRQQIVKEINAGRVAGPLKKAPTTKFDSSPHRVSTKKDTGRIQNDSPFIASARSVR